MTVEINQWYLKTCGYLAPYSNVFEEKKEALKKLQKIINFSETLERVHQRIPEGESFCFEKKELTSSIHLIKLQNVRKISSLFKKNITLERFLSPFKKRKPLVRKKYEKTT